MEIIFRPHHFTLTVRDIDESASFYSIFGTVTQERTPWIVTHTVGLARTHIARVEGSSRGFVCQMIGRLLTGLIGRD